MAAEEEKIQDDFKKKIEDWKAYIKNKNENTTEEVKKLKVSEAYEGSLNDDMFNAPVLEYSKMDTLFDKENDNGFHEVNHEEDDYMHNKIGLDYQHDESGDHNDSMECNSRIDRYFVPFWKSGNNSSKSTDGSEERHLDVDTPLINAADGGGYKYNTPDDHIQATREKLFGTSEPITNSNCKKEDKKVENIQEVSIAPHNNCANKTEGIQEGRNAEDAVLKPENLNGVSNAFDKAEEEKISESYDKENAFSGFKNDSKVDNIHRPSTLNGLNSDCNSKLSDIPDVKWAGMSSRDGNLPDSSGDIKGCSNFTQKTEPSDVSQEILNHLESRIKLQDIQISNYKKAIQEKDMRIHLLEQEYRMIKDANRDYSREYIEERVRRGLEIVEQLQMSPDPVDLSEELERERIKNVAYQTIVADLTERIKSNANK